MSEYEYESESEYEEVGLDSLPFRGGRAGVQLSGCACMMHNDVDPRG